MFWTKAIPSERMNAEQIKRRFEVVEAPDSAIFLASAMNILATGLGYKISADQNTSVLGDGRPIPMMSYGVVEYLLGLDLRDLELRLSLRYRRRCAVQRRLVLVHRRLRRILVSRQLDRAVVLELSVDRHCLRRSQLRRGPIDLRLVGRPLDLIEQIAGFDFLAFGK